MKRVESIDVVRGLAMIIMALDHTRDFLHIDSLSFSPTDLATAEPALFFTRWITHFCAPIFVFLSGVSAFLTCKKSHDIGQLRKHFLTRGIVLILMDFTIVNFGIWFDLHFNIFLWNVLSAIGFGLIVLSFLLRLNWKLIGILGISIIFIHNAIPLLPISENLQKSTGFLFTSAVFPIGSKVLIFGYPPIPWLGVLLTGFAFGRLFIIESPLRKKRFLFFGVGSLLLFIVLRLLNIYGDPSLWLVQKNQLFTFLSFINVTKYPPSLLFCLMTLGFMFLLFYFVEGIKNRLVKIISVFGKVPLFYFLVHWYIIHPVLFMILLSQGFQFSQFTFGDRFGRPKDVESGVSLMWVYVFWILLVVAMYPLCRWYFKYKNQHKEKKWLRYI